VKTFVIQGIRVEFSRMHRKPAQSREPLQLACRIGRVVIPTVSSRDTTVGLAVSARPPRARPQVEVTAGRPETSHVSKLTHG
jgi:hypothetical protein